MIVNTFDLSYEENIELLPEKFYKYTKISENLKENLSKGQLWFASANTFNDPFDCKAYLTFGETELECRENFKKYKSQFKIEFSDYQEKIIDYLLSSPKDFNHMFSERFQYRFEKEFGITCFSENYKNTLMWAHYADSHRGIVLEFKKDLNGFLTKNLLPVVYHKSYPIIKVSDYGEGQMLATAYQMICGKGKDWKYEKEWRAISKKANKLLKFKKNELVGIIFGLSTTTESKEELYKLINESGYKNINFREAVFISDTFKIKYQKYNCS